MNETKLEPIDDELVQTYKKACAIFKNDMRKTFLGFKWKYYKKTFTAEDITIEEVARVMSALNGYEFVVKDGKILGEPFVMEEEFDLDHEISLIK